MNNVIKVVLVCSFIVVFGNACTKTAKEKEMSVLIDEALSSATRQSLRMAEKYADQDSILPRTYVNGKMITSDSRWWTSGFFPGVLWYLYENSGDKELLRFAKKYTLRIEREKFTTNNHDVGFMLYCSFGNGLRITGDTTYNEVLLTGAKSLATRYNKKLGLIRSWDFYKRKWQYPVIIDNMMNLELLLWASDYSGEEFLKELSILHANKTLKHHYREDFSCYHVVSYDTINGLPHVKQTHQGYSNESSWSRGQAWGLYGYTLMYRETGIAAYLDHAQKIADYILSHKNLPETCIPYWDFDAPNNSNEESDASAAAIMASAFIELSGFVDANLAKRYLTVAEKQIRILASPEFTAKIGENGDFILKHSVGSKPHNLEVDVPLTYADYYYVEALLRYKKLLGGKMGY